MRKTTERPEGVESGTARLIGTEIKDIFNAASELLSSQDAYNRMAKAVNPYGDGQASIRIREALFEYFGIN